MRSNRPRTVTDPACFGFVRSMDRRYLLFALLAGWALLVLAGCASPPAVGMLMRGVEEALTREHRALADDLERSDRWFEQQRQALTAGFEADLADREALTADWVRDHARVYAAAREALVERQLEQAEQLRTRRENLALASALQRRAITLIERQDALFDRIPDLRRMLLQREGTAKQTSVSTLNGDMP